MTEQHPDFELDAYDYDLPEELVAQRPAGRRDESKLMLLDRVSGETCARRFSELPQFLPEGSLLVANNSRVVPARLFGSKPSGGKVEFLLLTPLPLLDIRAGSHPKWNRAEAYGLIKASKAPKPGDEVVFAEDLRMEVKERLEYGRCQVELVWRGSLPDIFFEHGHQPLPPYIKRDDTPSDGERYQTIYADQSKTGSVAAPTAGLHFTPEMRESLKNAGFGWSELTLYVGYGTFSPVRDDDVRRHVMHAEYVEIPQETATAVAAAKSEGRPVVAVGTTTVRALEGAYLNVHGIQPFRGWVDLFIYPGFKFNVVDHLLTNFHLPRSSLLMMVSAFAGRETMLRAYREAIRQEFRFYSYGDSMFIF